MLSDNLVGFKTCISAMNISNHALEHLKVFSVIMMLNSESYMIGDVSQCSLQKSIYSNSEAGRIPCAKMADMPI